MPDLKALIGKLNLPCRRALERAAERCRAESQFAVEIEHLLVELAGIAEGDMPRALGALELDPKTLARELAAAIAGLRRGNDRTPAFAPPLIDLLVAAWTAASLDFGLERIRSAAILAALLNDVGLRGRIAGTVPLLAQIPPARLMEILPDAMAGSAEDVGAAEPPDEAGRAALDLYAVDLTAEAHAGRMDPIIGRDAEIRQVIDVLMRRRQNNPILAGDAGVGKTAIIEGLAQRIVAGAVPPALAQVRLLSLDLGALQAGAAMKGEFQQRLKRVVDEVTAAEVPIILFIDEAHMLIGAGGAAGQSDAANLLKPALARGALRTIAATTWAEYKRHIEPDPALARRFQPIRVGEPDEATACEMLRALAPKLEAHHGVQILDEAVVDAVRLSHRYMLDRHLPDKAVSVLDTASARVLIAQSAAPAELELAARRCAALETEMAELDREARTGLDHAARLDELGDELDHWDEEHQRLVSRWEQERETVQRIVALRHRLESEADPQGELAAEAGALRLELEALQGERPLVPVAVDGRAVAEVVASWTGTPVGRMLTDTLATARALRARMAERIVGQDAALDTICRRIQTFYAELGEPQKPTGVFLLAGPSGVGKTETAATLADLLFGGATSLVTVNMSEYQEAHSVSGLKGAPPGYVGYGRGGVLTEAVRRTPYCVLLLDEVEKAHPDVLELFYQVFDKGVLDDSEGRPVDFTNTIILLTSNLGSATLARHAGRKSTPDGLVDAIRPELLTHFPPALLGRMVIVPYVPLDEPMVRQIVRLKLGQIQARFAAVHGAELTYEEQLVESLARQVRETDSGARRIDQILTDGLLPDLSQLVLDRLTEGAALGAVHIGLAATGALTYTARS
jgi:type VI secretion system protein VasG